MTRKPLYYPFARVLAAILFTVIYPLEVQNGYKLPKKGKMIVCSNHVHVLDPAILDYSQWRMICFMAKTELFEGNKWGADFIRSLGAFPVTRGNDGGRAIENAKRLLDDNDCVGVFIEGTRSKTGELGRAHAGAILIAHQTNTPITPCCITPRTGFFTPFKKTKVMFGEPITCEELGVKEGTNREYREAAKKVMEIIADMRKKHREEFDGKKRKQKKEE